MAEGQKCAQGLARGAFSATIWWDFRNAWLCMGRHGSPRVVRSHSLKSWPSCTLDQTSSFLQSHCAAHRVTLRESRHNATAALALGIQNNNKGARTDRLDEGVKPQSGYRLDLPPRDRAC